MITLNYLNTKMISLIMAVIEMSNAGPIMFDMDGVLTDFVAGFMSVAHDIYDYDVYGTVDQPQWDFAHMKKEHISKVWRFICNCRQFWAELPLLAKEIEMERLSNLTLKHQVYFCTSRSGIWPNRQTVHWLETHGVVDPSVINLPPHGTKGELAHALGASYSIEDKAGNALCIDYMSDAKSYILNQRYNQFNHDALGRKVKRVYSVGEYISAVEEGLGL